MIIAADTPSALADEANASVRILIIPGLHNSGPGHWQTWLQAQYRSAVRVHQRDWHRPDLEAWSDQIRKTIDGHPGHIRWIAVAHSFGCLALAHHLAARQADFVAQDGIQSALLVAPADPGKFGLEQRLPARKLDLASTLIGSETDPWMPLDDARLWARRWGARFLNLGQAGHINHQSGHGPWPRARQMVDRLIRDQQQRWHGHASMHPPELHCTA